MKLFEKIWQSFGKTFANVEKCAFWTNLTQSKVLEKLLEDLKHDRKLWNVLLDVQTSLAKKLSQKVEKSRFHNIMIMWKNTNFTFSEVFSRTGILRSSRLYNKRTVVTNSILMASETSRKLFCSKVHCKSRKHRFLKCFSQTNHDRVSRLSENFDQNLRPIGNISCFCYPSTLT